MPNWCANKIEIDGDKAERLRMVEFIRGEKSEFDFNKLFPYPEKFVKMDIEKEDSGYNAGGYEWCSENWGTKWNAECAHVAGDGSEISFDTAWSPSLPVTEALSKLFPDLTFKHAFEEGGLDFSGYLIYKAGECIGEVNGGFDDYPISEHYENDGL